MDEQDNILMDTAPEAGMEPDADGNPIGFDGTSEEYAGEDMLPEGWKDGDGLEGLAALAAELDPLWRQEPKPPDDGAAEQTDRTAETSEAQEPKPETEPEAKPETEPEAAGTEPEAEPDWKAIAKRYQEREAAEKYRSIYRQQVDAGMTDAAARMVARGECGGREYPLTEEPEAAAGEPSPGQAFRAGLERLSTLFPDVREMPKEVTRAVLGGADVVSAYTQYRMNQDKKTIADLREKVAVLEQNAANRERAVARGVAGETGQRPKDPWLEGFDSYQW